MHWVCQLLILLLSGSVWSESNTVANIGAGLKMLFPEDSHGLLMQYWYNSVPQAPSTRWWKLRKGQRNDQDSIPAKANAALGEYEAGLNRRKIPEQLWSAREADPCHSWDSASIAKWHNMNLSHAKRTKGSSQLDKPSVKLEQDSPVPTIGSLDPVKITMKTHHSNSLLSFVNR